MNQRERDVLSLLRTQNRELSVGYISEKLNKQRSTILSSLEELAVQGYIDVVRRPGHDEIRRVKVREEGAQAFVDSVRRPRVGDVQSQLDELRAAIDELRQVTSHGDPEEWKKNINPERINTLLDIVTKAPQVVSLIKHLF